jgi:hypothetical protein
MSIELECKQVVDDISNNIGTNFELEAILNYCKASFSLLPNFKINFCWQGRHCLKLVLIIMIMCHLILRMIL